MANSNKGRKFFATAATAALVASAIVPVASAAQVNDLNSVSDYAKEAVQDLVDRGVITGDEKGNFNPKASVKRSEAAKILAEALGYEADSSVTFPDVAATAWYAKYVAAVASEGLFAGDEKGNFNPEGTLTRSQAAKILVIALGLEGSADLSEFKDAKSAQAWAVDYLEIAVANGVLKGENGNLKPNDNITRQDFAVMFSRAELAADPLAQLEKLVEQVKDALADLVTDVTKENLEEAKDAAEAAEAVIAKAEAALEAADEAGLLTDDEVAAAKAGLELAKAKLETAKKAIAAAEAGEVTISSVSAINSKALKVTFNTPVEDTSKASFALTRDGSKANVSSVEWNTEKTEATVTLTSKLVKGEYTVSVTGLSEKALTGSVQAEDEKVAAITVLTKEVPLVELDTDGVDDLAVPYKVTNQYGEDITKTTTLVTSQGTVDQANGLIKIIGNFDTITNKTTAFSLINVESGVSTVATITAVASSVVSEVSVVGVYNANGKVLSETSPASEVFYLEIEAKDQYGNKVAAPAATSIYMSETNPLVADVANNVVGGVATQNPAVTTSVVNGKVLIPITPVKAGSSTVTLIAAASGKTTSYNLVVAEGQRVNSVSFGQPDVVAVGESAYIPFTAYDKNGNEITDIKTLKDSVRGLGVASGDTIILDEGQFYIETATNTTAGPVVKMIQIKPTLQYLTVNYTVKAAAVPTVVTGLKASAQTTLSAGLSTSISTANIIVEDQYGRTMTKAQLDAWLGATTGSPAVSVGNKIVVTSEIGSPTDLSPLTATVGGGSDSVTNNITSSSDAITLTAASSLTGKNKTEQITVALAPAGTVSTATAKDFTFSVATISEYTSYEVSAPTVVFNGTTDTYGFKVYGVKANGAKVLLEKSQYNVVLPSALVFDASNDNNNLIKVGTVLTSIDDDATTTNIPDSADLTVKVVIGDAAATTITKTVKVSATSKASTEVKASTNGTSSGTDLGTVLTISEGDLATAGELVTTDLDTFLYFVNQYGQETASVEATGGLVLTFSNLVDAGDTTGAAIATSVNGTSTAKVTGLDSGDTVTVKVEFNGVSKTYTVKIVD